MKPPIYIFVLYLIFAFKIGNGQAKYDFSGQISWLNAYSKAQNFNSSIRYIPQFSGVFSKDSTRKIDFETSLNLTASYLPDSGTPKFNPAIYRFWLRYSTKQSEIRLGLQQIDFGSASLLRPLQWFNRIDPRDPLRITNGVYALLGRYYFVNNANVWFWTLINNSEVRGMDIFGSKNNLPEIGGRVQFPLKKGEFSLNYHFRNAYIVENQNHELDKTFAENRFGFDTKLDLKLGLWLEASTINRKIEIGSLKNQTAVSIGTDYTFSLGSGLNFLFEKMWIGFGEKPGKYSQNIHINALVGTYPININNRISLYGIYSQKSEIKSLVGNFEHQFKKVSAYFMLFYNQTGSFALLQNQMGPQFNGTGFNILMTYNH